MRHVDLGARKRDKAGSKRLSLRLRIQRRVSRGVERDGPIDLDGSDAELEGRGAEGPDGVRQGGVVTTSSGRGDDLDLRGIDGDVPEVRGLDDVVAGARRRASGVDNPHVVRDGLARRLVEVEGQAVEERPVVHGRGVVGALHDARLRLEIYRDGALALRDVEFVESRVREVQGGGAGDGPLTLLDELAHPGIRT